MTLRVTISEVQPDIVVLHLSGSMTISPETEALESFLRDVLALGHKKLVFDLAAIEEVEPAAIALFVKYFYRTQAAGGQLRFAGPNEEVLRLFQAAMIDTVLPFDLTVDAACEHLRGGLDT